MSAPAIGLPPLSWLASLVAHGLAFSLLAHYWQGFEPKTEPLPLEVVLAAPVQAQMPVKLTKTTVPKKQLEPVVIAPAKATWAPRIVEPLKTDTAEPVVQVKALAATVKPVLIAEASPIILPMSYSAPARTSSAPITVPMAATGVTPGVTAKVASALVRPAEPVGSPGPAPAVKDDGQKQRRAAEQEQQWRSLFVDKLRELKRYPMSAKRLGQEGVVVVSITVAPDGELVRTDIAKASGYGLLDRDATKLVRQAILALAGLVTPGRQAHWQIPIAYRLED